MITRLSLSFALLAAMPVWAQVEPSATISGPPADDSLQMRIPPTVRTEAYPTTVGSEQRSNYLAAGLILSTAYDNNVLGGAGTKPVSDVSYTIWPTITLDQTTSRQHRTFTYSPGFTFYQPTSSLNEVNHNASLDFQYRLSQHSAIIVGDSFQKSSNVFDQPDSLSAGAVSGSAQSPPTQVIAPFADRLSNATNVALNYQFSRNGMIGAGGTASELNYPNSAEAPGFYDSNSRGGSAFYSHRLSGAQYIGATYQYLWAHANPVNTLTSPANSRLETKTQSLLPFYTIYSSGKLSLSLAGGPQHFDAAQPLSPAYRSWRPSALASIGWQGNRTVCSANYSRTVTGGVGVLGAFESNDANASARWQMTRAWTVGSAGTYAINRNLTPLLPSSIPGGHTVMGTFTIQHSDGEHFKTDIGYSHLHQSYSGIAVIDAAPDSDRVYISVSYQLTRPLGR